MPAEAVLCQVGDCSAALGQLLYLGGIPAARGSGEDAAGPGAAALLGMLPTFCRGLPTPARDNQKKRMCSPQYAVANTNRGMHGASSLLHAVLRCGDV